MLPYTVNFKVSARTLTGALNAHNKAAVDWGWQGLIAYGCHSLVVVVDSITAQTLQVPADRTAFGTARTTVCYSYVSTVDHKKHQDVSATAGCWYK
ncbi:WDR11 isoform 5 [Pongo abelii]|uniref:WDR11 isoform 5 n=1 Tax=Pongo abelii TaxID=9601 RepID=A0A2J8W6P6_PONAB|nr:WDR11 isoform 5 [Pongo abelii]